MRKILVSRFVAPCGVLVVGECGGRVCMCDWDVEPRHGRVVRRLGAEIVAEGRTALIEEAFGQLEEYFSGARRRFELPVAVAAGTEMQRRVWQELMSIDYGATVSYGELAARVGRPRAVRAVASAVGANPMSVLLPCHRVVGARNSLGGYAGGLAAKEYLLSLERGQRAS